MSRKNKPGKFDVVVKKVPKLSNGMKSTNENWREFARLAFGDKSAAVTYMDMRIEKSTPKTLVRDTEQQMRLMLATIHDHPEMLDAVKREA